MPAIHCVETGLVYRNPKPHLRSIHTWHPSLAVLDSGRIVAGFDTTEAISALNYRTCTAFSDDAGRTWSAPEPIFTDREKRPHPTTHSVRLSRTKDNTLLAFGGLYHRIHPEEGISNSAHGFGSVPVDLILLRSRDGGKSWEGPQIVKGPLPAPAYEICHRILVLRDGRWMAIAPTYPEWNGNTPAGMKVAAFYSHDQGRTWPDLAILFDAWDQGLIHFEPSVDQLPDGRLLTITWVYHAKTGETFPTPYSLSADGKTFSPPQPTGLHGQTAKIHVLPDGRVLTLYRRHDKPGLWANLSRIDGDRWTNLAEAPMWQGAESGMAGAGGVEHKLRTLKFGFPSMVQLPDGDVLAAFWCLEDCIHNIRWLRLRVDK